MDEVDRGAEFLLERGEAVFGGGEIGLLGFLDQRTDPIDPPPVRERAADGLDHLVEALDRQRAGVDRLPAGGLFPELGNVHVAEIGEHQRARDRRRGHHQHVDGVAFPGERQALVHAEAMLLVDDREAEIAKFDVVLEQRMGADQDVDVAKSKPFEHRRPLAAALAAGQDRHFDAGFGGERRDGGVMLPRQDFGRRHQGRLASAFDDGRRGKQRHHGLAGADVALQHAEHPFGLGQVGGNVGDGLRLRLRERVGQRIDELLAQRAGA